MATPTTRQHTEVNSADIFPTYRISNWEDANRVLAHFSKYAGIPWIFRGVSDAKKHRLQPKVGRPERKMKIAGRFPYKEIDEVAALEAFMHFAYPYLNHTPATDLEWMAVAQHYGLPTRLLDWTENFLVALWFAVSKLGHTRNEKSGKKRIPDAAIYVTRDVPAVDSRAKKSPFRIDEVLMYRPPLLDARIRVQRSMFTLHPLPNRETKPRYLQKIIVSGAHGFGLFKRLDAAGINEQILFPDLQGVSNYVGWQYRNNYLISFRGEASRRLNAEASIVPPRQVQPPI